MKNYECASAKGTPKFFASRRHGRQEANVQRSTSNVQLAESGKANQEPHENRKGTREARREKQEVGRVDIRSFLCQGDFEGTAGALTFTSTFLVWLPPPENWPLKKKSAAATMITKITNIATTAALLPPPLLSAIDRSSFMRS
jgi:hypothetical protein